MALGYARLSAGQHAMDRIFVWVLILSRTVWPIRQDLRFFGQCGGFADVVLFNRLHHFTWGRV